MTCAQRYCTAFSAASGELLHCLNMKRDAFFVFVGSGRIIPLQIPYGFWTKLVAADSGGDKHFLVLWKMFTIVTQVSRAHARKAE